MSCAKLGEERLESVEWWPDRSFPPRTASHSDGRCSPSALECQEPTVPDGHDRAVQAYHVAIRQPRTVAAAFGGHKHYRGENTDRHLQRAFSHCRQRGATRPAANADQGGNLKRDGGWYPQPCQALSYVALVAARDTLYQWNKPMPTTPAMNATSFSKGRRVACRRACRCTPCAHVPSPNASELTRERNRYREVERRCASGRRTSALRCVRHGRSCRRSTNLKFAQP
jgi:hypothetical protein